MTAYRSHSRYLRRTAPGGVSSYWDKQDGPLTALEALTAGQTKPTYVYMCTGFKWHCLCPRHSQNATPEFRRANQFKRLDEMTSRPAGSMVKRA